MIFLLLINALPDLIACLIRADFGVKWMCSFFSCALKFLWRSIVSLAFSVILRFWRNRVMWDAPCKKDVFLYSNTMNDTIYMAKLCVTIPYIYIFRQWVTHDCASITIRRILVPMMLRMMHPYIAIHRYKAIATYNTIYRTPGRESKKRHVHFTLSLQNLHSCLSPAHYVMHKNLIAVG